MGTVTAPQDLASMINTSAVPEQAFAPNNSVLKKNLQNSVSTEVDYKAAATEQQVKTNVLVQSMGELQIQAQQKFVDINDKVKTSVGKYDEAVNVMQDKNLENWGKINELTKQKESINGWLHPLDELALGSQIKALHRETILNNRAIATGSNMIAQEYREATTEFDNYQATQVATQAVKINAQAQNLAGQQKLTEIAYNSDSKIQKDIAAGLDHLRYLNQDTESKSKKQLDQDIENDVYGKAIYALQGGDLKNYNKTTFLATHETLNQLDTKNPGTKLALARYVAINHDMAPKPNETPIDYSNRVTDAFTASLAETDKASGTALIAEIQPWSAQSKIIDLGNTVAVSRVMQEAQAQVAASDPKGLLTGKERDTQVASIARAKLDSMTPKDTVDLAKQAITADVVDYNNHVERFTSTGKTAPVLMAGIPGIASEIVAAFNTPDVMEAIDHPLPIPKLRTAELTSVRLVQALQAKNLTVKGKPLTDASIEKVVQQYMQANLSGGYSLSNKDQVAHKQQYENVIGEQIVAPFYTTFAGIPEQQRATMDLLSPGTLLNLVLRVKTIDPLINPTPNSVTGKVDRGQQ